MSTGSIQTDFGDPFRPKSDAESEVDGACFSTSQQETEDDEVFVTPLARVHKDFVYNTEKGRIGLVVIFNHRELKTRVTTTKDNFNIIPRIKDTWEKLQFEVWQCDDLSKTQIVSQMKKVSSTIENYACFVCVVKTQGKEDELRASDGWYNANNLWKPFLDKEKCKWHGKPKVFILEAQRGTKVDTGIRLERLSRFDVTDATKSEQSTRKSYEIPLHADFLFVHSTFYGHVSYEDDNGVPIFLNELNDVLKKHAKDVDFESMLTIVKYKLAHYMPNDMIDTYKQMPCTFSTFTKILYFTSLKNMSLTDDEIDSIDPKRQDKEEELSGCPKVIIKGTLTGFNVKKLKINMTVS